MPLSEFDLMLDMLAAATVHAEPRGVACVGKGSARSSPLTTFPRSQRLIRAAPPLFRGQSFLKVRMSMMGVSRGMKVRFRSITSPST